VSSLLAPTSADRIEHAFRTLQEAITDDLSRQGVDLEQLTFDRAFFAMYKGQTWDNRLPISRGAVTADLIPALVSRFHSFYQDSYGFSAEDLPVILSSVEVTAVIPRAVKLPAPTVEEAADSLLRTATVTLPGTGTAVTVPVHNREHLRPHQVVKGPALVSEKFATTLVFPGRRAFVDDAHLLTVEKE